MHDIEDIIKWGWYKGEGIEGMVYRGWYTGDDIEEIL